MQVGFICLGMSYIIGKEGETLCECDSPRSSKYQAVLLAGQAYSRGVNDGHKPFDV